MPQAEAKRAAKPSLTRNSAFSRLWGIMARACLPRSGSSSSALQSAWRASAKDPADADLRSCRPMRLRQLSQHNLHMKI